MHFPPFVALLCEHLSKLKKKKRVKLNLLSTSTVKLAAAVSATVGTVKGQKYDTFYSIDRLRSRPEKKIHFRDDL